MPDFQDLADGLESRDAAVRLGDLLRDAALSGYRTTRLHAARHYRQTAWFVGETQSLSVDPATVHAR
jgi:hypothetical protein